MQDKFIRAEEKFRQSPSVVLPPLRSSGIATQPASDSKPEGVKDAMVTVESPSLLIPKPSQERAKKEVVFQLSSILMDCFWVCGISALILTVCVLAQYKTADNYILGQPPNSLATSSNIQGIYTGNGLVILYPVVSILFIFCPWVMDKGRTARFKFQLYWYLLKCTTTGVASNTLLEWQLKALESSIIFFLTHVSHTIKHKVLKQFPYYVESSIWLGLMLVIAIFVGEMVIVRTTALTTISVGAMYNSYSTSLLNVTSPDCITNIASKAVSVALENFVVNGYTTYSYWPIIYGINTARSDGVYPYTIVGFGFGIPMWSDSDSMTWKNNDPAFSLGCNSTYCFVAAGDQKKYYTSTLDLGYIFNRITAMDPTTSYLASQSSLKTDAALTAQNITQAVSYSLLSGYNDEAIKSNIYRLGYLISHACAQPSSKMTETPIYGYDVILAWYNFGTRPIYILTPAIVYWYSPSAYVIIIVLTVVCMTMALIPNIILLWCWFQSPVYLWYPLVAAFRDDGNYRLFHQFDHPFEYSEGDFKEEDENRLLFLYFNPSTRKCRLEPLGFEHTHPEWIQIKRGDHNHLASIRRGCIVDVAPKVVPEPI
ncbi:hypothetical protein HDV03_001037 [Kappamyces sp. JEL0829]|nr:hypothetical protein HDV03_001037 [Kappamyces sp. JEL0829]